MGFKSQIKVIGNTPKKVAEETLLSSTLGENDRLKKQVKTLTESNQNLSSQLSFLEDKDVNSLSEQELMFLLHFIKEASFIGAQLEHVFQVTLKLQNQYKFIEKNQKKVD